MRHLLPYMNSFNDEIVKIAQNKKASASQGALFGGMVGAGLTKGWRGALIGAGLGGAVGGAASLGKKLLEPSTGQILASQQRAWEPDGYVPSWQRAGF